MSERSRARRGAAAPRLTARGSITLVFLITLAGYVLAAVLDSSQLVGVAFMLACLLGGMLVNSRELLSLVVTPPLIFFLATLVVQLGSAFRSMSILQALTLGLYQSLTAGAPWLFAGSALVLIITWRRGLGLNVSELRQELRTVPEPPRLRAAKDQVFVPEPEGYFEPKVYGTPRVEE